MFAKKFLSWMTKLMVVLCTKIGNKGRRMGFQEVSSVWDILNLWSVCGTFWWLPKEIKNRDTDFQKEVKAMYSRQQQVLAAIPTAPARACLPRGFQLHVPMAPLRARWVTTYGRIGRDSPTGMEFPFGNNKNILKLESSDVV